MGRKQDLRKVDWIAKEGGLTEEQRDQFGDYLHDCKSSGDKGTRNDQGDYTDDEMREKLKEFKDLIGQSGAMS